MLKYFLSHLLILKGVSASAREMMVLLGIVYLDIWHKFTGKETRADAVFSIFEFSSIRLPSICSEYTHIHAARQTVRHIISMWDVYSRSKMWWCLIQIVSFWQLHHRGHSLLGLYFYITKIHNNIFYIHY